MAWHKQKYFKVAIAFATLFVIIPLLYSFKSNRLSSPEVASKRKPIYEGMSAKGISLSEHKMGQLVYSVKIGSFKIKRKKIGFFKIGLIKVAHLDDVVFTINLDNLDENFQENSSPNSSGKDKSSANFIKNVLNSEQAKPLQLDKVKEVQINNLTVKIVDSEGPISVISSKRAGINLLKHKLVLQGEVKIASRERGTLTCKELYVSGTDQKFKTDSPYSLLVNNRVYKGKGLETNYLLEGINLGKPHPARKS